MHLPDSPVSIGFPPPLLGTTPLRLPVLAAAPGALALAKPAGVPWDDDSATGTPRPAFSVIAAVRRQLEADKPELRPFALERPASVWPLETETAGIGLLVSKGASLEYWRNAFGSGQLCFHYLFLAQGGDEGGDTFECELPVARHAARPMALISHASGKKSHTGFRRLERIGAWTWWEAAAHYPRFHQIRLHAAECGLRIAGESLYAQGDAPVLEQFLRRGRLNKGEARPLLDGLCLRLARVDCSGAAVSGWGELTAPEPPKWGVLRKKITSHPHCG
jgi:23S rRNA-/tRNA-specific pseudouridylate synthase